MLVPPSSLLIKSVFSIDLEKRPSGLTAQMLLGWNFTQLRAVLDDIPVKAAKTGMLTDGPTIEVVASILQAYSSIPLVVDPVMVSTSGHRLLQPSAVETLRETLLPLATIVTPNIDEASLLLADFTSEGVQSGGIAISSISDMKAAAAEISSRFRVPYVLLKGGHLTPSSGAEFGSKFLGEDTRVEYAGISDPLYPGILRAAAQAQKLYKQDETKYIVDILYGPGLKNSPSAPTEMKLGSVLFVHSRVDTKSTHGTGCTLSAALTCALARNSGSEQVGEGVLNAVRAAITYTHGAISAAASSAPIGLGNGPLNHHYQLSSLSIPRCAHFALSSTNTGSLGAEIFPIMVFGL